MQLSHSRKQRKGVVGSMANLTDNASKGPPQEITQSLADNGATSPKASSSDIMASELEAKQPNDQVSASEVKQDDQSIVTPYAFGVAPHLLGVPLASPMRRFVALMIDSMIIAALSFWHVLLFPLAVARVCWMWRQNIVAGQRFSSLRPFLKVMSYFFVFVFSVSAFDELASAIHPDEPSVYSENTQSDEEDATALVYTVGEDDEDPESVPSVISWAEGILTDLGLSFGWAAAYYTFLTAWRQGQTYGKRLVGIQVIKLDGSALSVWESFGRYGGYGAGFATGLLGFAQIYWDANRQSIQDKISETLVISKR